MRVREIAAAIVCVAAAAGSSGVARAAGLTVDVPPSGCPRRKDVVVAIDARLPGLTRADGATTSVRRLSVATGADGSVTLQVWDERGAVALERRLGEARPASGGQDAQCQALAEAAALVLERYLRDIGYHPRAASVPAPPEPPRDPGADVPPPVVAATPVQAPAAPVPPPPPPATSGPSPAPVPARLADRARPSAALGAANGRGGAAPAAALHLGVTTGARVANAGLPEASVRDATTRGELLVGVVGHLGPLVVSIAAGATSATTVAVAAAPGAELRLRAFPVRVAAGLRLPVPGGALVPGVAFDAGFSSFRAVGLEDARAGVRFDPAADAGLSYLVLRGPLTLAAGLAAGVTLAPRDFEVGVGEPVYRTPAAYLRAVVEMGVRLWKN